MLVIVRLLHSSKLVKSLNLTASFLIVTLLAYLTAVLFIQSVASVIPLPNTIPLISSVIAVGQPIYNPLISSTLSGIMLIGLEVKEVQPLNILLILVTLFKFQLDIKSKLVIFLIELNA